MANRAGPGPDDLDADLLDPTAAGELDEATALALADELDLHAFQPRDCADVVAEYLRCAQDAGVATVRIIHGKGSGALRRTVHAVLDRHPAVQAYRLADERSGGWGATLVTLRSLG